MVGTVIAKVAGSALGATYTMPAADGSAGEFLKTDGSTNLSFGAIATTGFSDVHQATSGSSTYTVPADITKLLVIITGGGGGGASGNSGLGQQGWGGGAATTVIARVTVVAADTITIAIGAGGAAASGGGNDGTIGGDSTFTHASGSGSGSMSTITSPGGKPGRYLAEVVAPAAGTVGANNEGISILGGYGNPSDKEVSGGASFWGGGGQGARQSVMQARVGPAYGSGGGGGSGTSSYDGAAAGADGICFIIEFK